MEIVAELRLRREPGFLYFVAGSDVMRVKMKRAGVRYSHGRKLVARGEFRREPGWLYFINGDGNVARTQAAQFRERRSVAKEPAAERGDGVVVKLGIRRKAGHLYFLRGTDVMMVPMKRAGARGGGGAEVVVAHCNFRRQEGYLYYIDLNGDVARAKRAVGGVE